VFKEDAFPFGTRKYAAEISGKSQSTARYPRSLRRVRCFLAGLIRGPGALSASSFLFVVVVACMIRHGSVREQRVDFCSFSRSSARLGGARGAAGLRDYGAVRYLEAAERRGIYDNAVINMVNGRAFPVETLRKTHTRTHLCTQPVGVRVLMSHHTPPWAL